MTDRDPRLSKIGVTRLADRAYLQWVCQVVHSGYHNGAHCRPHDPHGDNWGCGYYWHSMVPAHADGRVRGSDD